jgi:hypothetical protein
MLLSLLPLTLFICSILSVKKLHVCSQVYGDFTITSSSSTSIRKQSMSCSIARAHGNMENHIILLIARWPEMTTEVGSIPTMTATYRLLPAALFVRPVVTDWCKLISLFYKFTFLSLVWNTWRTRKDLAPLKIDRITIYRHCPTTSARCFGHRVVEFFLCLCR